MKILKNLLLTVFITTYFGCMQEQEVEEEVIRLDEQSKKNQPSINNKAVQNNLKTDIVKDEIKEQAVEASVVNTVIEKPYHPSDGFLYNANRAEPWKAYQNYDQMPSRLGDDDFFLWSFKVNPRTTDLFKR